MKAATALALALAVTLAGCAGDPYSGYGGNVYYDDYRPYAYGVPYYGTPYYASPYYGYPAIGGTFYYDRRDHDRDRWQRRPGDREHWQDRGRGDRVDRGERRDRNNPRPSREPLDMRHGEAGNEAGM